MLRVARADHLWPTARRFPETHDLGLATHGGFHDFSRMARLWGSRAARPESVIPKKDAYSLLLTFKVDGIRIAGGLYDLADSRVGADQGAFENVVYHYFELQLGAIMPPGTLSVDLELKNFSISVCVKRNRDQKCLHLFTDVPVNEQTYVEDRNTVAFNEHRNHADLRKTSAFALLGDANEICAPDVELSSLVFVDDGDSDDSEDSLLVGFRDDCVARLVMWRKGGTTLDVTDVLRQWHASTNWV